MTTLNSDEILQHVPAMRRYAVLLCLGDRDRGDQLVETTLIDIVAKPSMLNGQADHRLNLLKAMQQAMRADPSAVPASIDLESTQASMLEDAYCLLAQMPVEQRSAVLLVVVEGLSHVDTAQVLGTTAQIVGALLVDAREYLEETTPQLSKTG